MINITEVFRFVVRGTNIFTLNTEQAIGVKIDELAKLIGEAVSYGYERGISDYLAGPDLLKAAKRHKEEMQLTMKTVMGGKDA